MHNARRYKMLKHPALTEAKVKNLIARIYPADVYPENIPVDVEIHEVKGEPITYQEAVKRKYKPLAKGQEWGSLWDTVWFKVKGKVPAKWKGSEVVARISFNYIFREGFSCEGLIWMDGKPVTAINMNRDDIPITRKASGSESFEFYVEVGANPMGECTFNGRLLAPDYNSAPQYKITEAVLSIYNREANDIYSMLNFALETMKALPEGQRKGRLLYALNDAVNVLEPGDMKSLRKAIDLVMPELKRKNGDTVHKISATGHAHIDTAWLWPLRETVRKCSRTFSTALKYMDEYPEYVFSCSQAVQYAWMKKNYPDIFKGIKEKTKRGQWEPVGSMWVEPDCNISSGESLVRQIFYGKKFFREELGVDTKDLWLPDVFGYSAALPQILKKSGIDVFTTIKISWNQFNKFPYHTFFWKGIDGTEIFSHFPPCSNYNGFTEPWELLKAANEFKENDRCNRSLYMYGWGDGGGGPTRKQIEWGLLSKDVEGLPQVTLEPSSEFFKKAQKDAKDLPEWVGELYLELHRGTYTTQARTKRANRKNELNLRNAEFLDALSFIKGTKNSTELIPSPEFAIYEAPDESRGKSPRAKHAEALDRAWKMVLTNQFHDIIPGSSINWVYKDNLIDHEKVEALAKGVSASAISGIADEVSTKGIKNPMMLVNTLSFKRGEVIDINDRDSIYTEVPSMGYSVVDAKKLLNKLPEGLEPVMVSVKGGKTVITNGLLKITVDANGLISSIIDLEAGNREVLPKGAKGNLFQLHKDRPVNWDAWDVDVFYKETVTDITELKSFKVLYTSQLKTVVRIEREFSGSKLVQDMIVRAGTKRIDFVTDVDWNEQHKMLKVAFPVEALAPKAVCEIQFGHVERPTHYNTSWDMAKFEVCAHKYVDISEHGYGAALINDCKYGHDIHGNTMRLSLLRAPTAPDPEADRGKHKFTYSFLPHKGDFRAAGVISESYSLNIPVISMPLAENQSGKLPSSMSFFKIKDNPAMVIEAVKVSDDGKSVIVRLYESFGSRGSFTMESDIPFKSASLTNLLEEKQADLKLKDKAVSLEVKPFEIITISFQL